MLLVSIIASVANRAGFGYLRPGRTSGQCGPHRGNFILVAFGRGRGIYYALFAAAPRRGRPAAAKGKVGTAAKKQAVKQALIDLKLAAEREQAFFRKACEFRDDGI